MRSNVSELSVFAGVSISVYISSPRPIMCPLGKSVHNERMRIGSFLRGNGCDKADIYAPLAPRLGNESNHAHLRGWLVELEREKGKVLLHATGKPLDRRNQKDREKKTETDREKERISIAPHHS